MQATRFLLQLRCAPNDELTHLTHTIARRVARHLERQGLLERDTGHTYLTADGVDEDPESPMNQLLGSSITYRIAVGSQQGRKVFTLQPLPAESDNLSSGSVAETAGFSLHAGVATKAHERDKLERLCRYITRPAISMKRLSLTRNGQVRYELKTPWRNGTTHVIFEPLDFMSRMDGMPRAQGHPDQWAQRLKRVFDIDIETCDKCDGNVRIIACIEDPIVIRKILAHLDEKMTPSATGMLPESRAPPATGLFV